MSLNGLDAAAVVEAHQAALTDAGGWLLLKYISRDTVDLLKKGNGGVAEVRGAIEEYTETSPLYGLVQYRRKKVILKYVPEGTSRLLQVRLTVQFQSVIEFLSPHDTVFSFTNASELTESALAMCAKFLAPAGSLTSSNSSLRRRRLNEITEGIEEGGEGPEEEKTLTPASPSVVAPIVGKSEVADLPASAILAKALLAKRKEAADASNTIRAPTPQSVESPQPQQDKNSLPQQNKDFLSEPAVLSLPTFDKSLPATPQPTPPPPKESLSLSLSPPSPKAEQLSTEPPPSMEPAPSEKSVAEQDHSRHMSTAESDSISQWSSNVASYTSQKKKKQKLGPRPHVDSQRRPKTSGTTEEFVKPRPIANLPNSIRVSTRSFLGIPKRPGSQQSSKSVPGLFTTSSQTGGLPPLPSPSHIASLYKAPESRGTLSRPPSVTTELSTATPEKLRLMKALQMRKRNMIISQRASALPTTYSSSSANRDFLSGPASPIFENVMSENTGNRSDHQESLVTKRETIKTDGTSNAESPSSATNVSQHLSTAASSFTSNDEPGVHRGSLSSDTSSSITPKAVAEQNKSKRSSTTQPTLPSLQISTNSDDQEPILANAQPAESEAQKEDLKATEPDSSGNESYKHLVEELSSPISEEITLLRSPTEKDDSYLLPSVESSPEKKISLSQRRRVVPESLQLVSGGDTSDNSDDDSLMEELHNATVHEAKPMSVARTPVTPVLAKPSADRVKDMNRVISASARKTPDSGTTTPEKGRFSGRTTPEKGRSGSSRSMSTALPQWPPLPTEPMPVPLTKKSTLGSGISKRIKALEVLSTKDSTSPPGQPTRDASTPRTTTFTTFIKRSSFLLHTQAPPIPSDNPPAKKLPPITPTKDVRSLHSSPQSWLQRQGPTTEIYAPSQKGETVSVTARIVRDPNAPKPSSAPTEGDFSSLNLHRSPLIVEHEKQEGSSSRPVVTRDHFFSSLDGSIKSPDKSRPSFSSFRSNTQPQYPQSEPSTRKMSFSSTHRKQISRMTSDNSSFTEEKAKGSRASRMLKRMSNLTSSSRRSTKSQFSPQRGERDQPHPDTIEERVETASHHESITDSPLHVVDVGDVNVQFPETLLWKRRFMRIDDQGNIIFSAPANEGNVRGITRRYHLRDFKVPSLPDLEREEMAWSILLDLKEGSSVQCACESKRAQQQVLHMLVDAHRAYHQLYGT